MAVTRRSLALLRDLRIEVGALADDAVRQIVEAWLTAWERLSEVWRDAIAEAVRYAARTGRWPSSWQLARIPEVGVAITATELAAGAAAGAAVAASIAAATGAVTAVAGAHPMIIASQLPAALVMGAAATYALKVLPGPLDEIRRQVSDRITAMVTPLAASASDAVRRILVHGVPTGDAAGAAKELLARAEAAFHVGQQRAATATRTETLDAMRAAAAYADLANSDVLDGWVWIADLGPRCCPSCWAMHGTVHGLAENGPADHVQGRCSRVPKLKPWARLGIDEPESSDKIPNAEKRWRALSRTDQDAVFGPARARLVRSGEVAWTDLAVLRESRSWRASYSPRSVRDLERLAGMRSQLR